MLQLFDSFFSTLETLRPLQFSTALAVLGGATDWNMHPLNAIPKVQEQIDRAGLVFQIADFQILRALLTKSCPKRNLGNVDSM